MPALQPRSLEDYVRGRDSEQSAPAESNTNGAAIPPPPHFGDLKLNTKAWPTANKSEIRSKHHHPSPVGGNPAHHGADVSSIGDTSTTPSPDAMKREAFNNATGQASNGHAEMETDFNNNGWIDAQQSEDEADQAAHDHLAQWQAELDDAVNQGQQDRFPTMKGDSYPPTTSGPPSPTALAELNTLPEVRLPKHQLDGQLKTQAGNFTKDGMLQRCDTEMEPAQEFRYQPVPIRTSSTKKQMTAPTMPEDPTAVPSTNTAYRDSAPSMSGLGVPAKGHAARSGGQGARATQQRDKTAATWGTAKPASHVNIQQRQAIPTPAEQAQQSSGNNADDENEDELDYERNTLFTMNYTELRAQVFDYDPNAPRPGRKQGQTLESRLQAVSEAPQQAQWDFFLALPLHEWEQAGDWFLERFGEVLNKFKAVRREKREAAMGFEDEVAKRYDAVGRKRKQTEAELSEMRENGGKLLQGTPKRAKMK